MKHVKYFFSFFFIPVIFSQSCLNISVFNCHTEKGNKRIVTKEIAPADYSAINFSTSGKIIYCRRPDEAPFLQVTTDENILPLLEIEVKNNQLNIEVKDGNKINPSQLTIQTNSRQLDKINIAGSGQIHQNGTLLSERLDVKITGSGNVIFDSLASGVLNVHITGSGNAQLNGTSREAVYTITGSGNIHAHDCSVEYLKCKITGSGNIRALADKTLDIKITGSGNVNYKGCPQIDSSITGSGTIKQIR